ncbi:MAG: hypothetical protein RSE19_00520, partial [Myroides sp.]
ESTYKIYSFPTGKISTVKSLHISGYPLSRLKKLYRIKKMQTVAVRSYKEFANQQQYETGIAVHIISILMN